MKMKNMYNDIVECWKEVVIPGMITAFIIFVILYFIMRIAGWR